MERKARDVKRRLLKKNSVGQQAVEEPIQVYSRTIYSCDKKTQTCAEDFANEDNDSTDQNNSDVAVEAERSSKVVLETCCICLQQFSSECYPTIISCSHIFCVNCYKTIENQTDVNVVHINCPLCRRKIKKKTNIMLRFDSATCLAPLERVKYRSNLEDLRYNVLTKMTVSIDKMLCLESKRKKDFLLSSLASKATLKRHRSKFLGIIASRELMSHLSEVKHLLNLIDRTILNVCDKLSKTPAFLNYDASRTIAKSIVNILKSRKLKH